MRKLGINSLIYTSGIVFNAFLGLVFYVVIARFLGPADFGVAAVALAVAVIASDIFDFGLNTAMLRFLPENTLEGKKDLGRSFLAYKLATAAITLLVGSITSSLLSQVIFKTSTHGFFIWLGFWGAAATILYGYVNSALLAEKRFFSSVVLNVLSNSLRLAALAIIVINGNLTIQLALILFAIPSFISALFWAVIDPAIMTTPKVDKTHLLAVFGFSKWVAGSIATGSLSSRLDNFLLVNLTSSFQTGIYTSVQRIFLAFNQLPAALGIVLAPDFSTGQDEKLKHAFRFGLLSSLLITCGLLVVFILASWIVPLILGGDFRKSVEPFRWLAIGTIFFVMAVPFNSFLLYARKKSNQIFIVALMQLFITAVFDLLLIPKFQAVGAAISYSFASAVGLIVYLLIYYFKD